MKYLTLLCDGMSDLPNENLDMKTPMEAAFKPNMDRLAGKSIVGLVKPTPAGMKPGSDIANMSVLGYNPKEYYTGRSPLEAASIGIELGADDVSFRCNLVTLSDSVSYNDAVMLDYSAGDISAEEAEVLIDCIRKEFGSDVLQYYAGVGYRHCLVWRGKAKEKENFFGRFTPPHDIADQKITSAMEKLRGCEPGKIIAGFMEKSYALLKDHPVNIKRVSEGKRPANSIWIWGEGVSARLKSFKEKTGLDGAVISAVDLLKGIGKLAGMETPEIAGATGYIDTNFRGKAEKAAELLKNGRDFVYLHIEAPDECGHRGEVENKVKAIEIIDREVLAPFLDSVKDEHIRILICPDHPTPLAIKTHTPDPVPFLIYDNRHDVNSGAVFSEAGAKATGIYIEDGFNLIEKLFNQ